MFSQFIAPIEIEVESEALPRSLDCAARRAKLRRGGKNRAATLGMTEGGVGPGRGDAQRIAISVIPPALSEAEPWHSHSWLCAFSCSVIPSGVADFFLRSRRANVGHGERDRGKI